MEAIGVSAVQASAAALNITRIMVPVFVPVRVVVFMVVFILILIPVISTTLAELPGGVTRLLDQSGYCIQLLRASIFSAGNDRLLTRRPDRSITAVRRRLRGSDDRSRARDRF
ncbi:hypothetical protein MACH15_26470 [Maricaulis maris]|nr:hypothetical protein MACH15_26470 [Maricaulis maris]